MPPTRTEPGKRDLGRIRPSLLVLLVLLAGGFRTSEGSPVRTFSHDSYARLLAARVDGRGQVDYAGLRQNPKDLDEYLETLARLEAASYETWPSGHKIAFWINAYNALTLKAVIDHLPIRASGSKAAESSKSSIRQIPGVWNRLEFRVLGQAMTLDRIEHKILRKEFREPRIHLALVCASMSCPPLRREPYLGETLETQLEDQVRRFLAKPENFAFDRARREVLISSIFKWYGGDFVEAYEPSSGFQGLGRTERAVLLFCALHVPEAERRWLETTSYRVLYQKYDWSLNEQEK